MLMGTHHQDVGSDGLVQCSAMAALGLLFAQTGHSFLAQRIVNEVGNLRFSDSNNSPYSVSLKIMQFKERTSVVMMSKNRVF